DSDPDFDASKRTWKEWKYVDWLRPWVFFTEYLANSAIRASVNGPTRAFIRKQEFLREQEAIFLTALNAQFLDDPTFADRPVFRPTDPPAELAKRLAEEPIAGLMELRNRAGSDSLAPEETRELNRLLLETFYPEWVRPRTSIRRVTVIEYDQAHR